MHEEQKKTAEAKDVNDYKTQDVVPIDDVSDHDSETKPNIEEKIPTNNDCDADDEEVESAEADYQDERKFSRDLYVSAFQAGANAMVMVENHIGETPRYRTGRFRRTDSYYREDERGCQIQRAGLPNKI